MSATIKATNLYSYQDQALNQRTLIAVATDGSGVPSIGNNVIYWDINGNPNNIFTPTRLAIRCRMTDSRDFAFFCDGVSSDLFKWNISSGLAKWGIASPVSGPTIGSVVGSGSITLIKGRIYYIAYYNATTQSYSDLSPASAITGPLTAQNQDLTGLAVSSDPQVDHKILLATADGGDPTTLYEITTLTNATTTYTDSMDEATLLVQNDWQDTDSNGVLHGLFGNQPPPNGSFPISHNGRIFMAIGEVLYFSKSLSECTTASGIVAGRYEEAWVPTNAINVATAAEEIRGLLTDGQTLYIGTEEHIFRLTGDSPQNFSEPQIIFPQTGLLSQDVWQLVYLEGTPVGTMWMTPDLRVMSSDFNTYQDVGTPIQGTLNTINPNALGAAWAVMVSNGPYNFYMLAIPTGSNTVPDTFCVYDMRLRKWYIWQFADQFLSGIFYINLSGIPRWIFVDSNGIVRLINDGDVVDRSTDSNAQSILSTVQTSWLDMGDPQLRKTLNEIEVITDDSAMLVTIDGASTRSQFESPVSTLVSNAVLTTSLFGASGDYKVYLAATEAIDRFYRVSFNSSSALSGNLTNSINVYPNLGSSSNSTFTVTVNVGSSGIKVGDFGILLVQANNNTTPQVATISDSLGNTWSSPGNSGTGTAILKANTTGIHDYISLCSAPMTVAVAPFSTFTITFSIDIIGGSNPSTVNEAVFVNVTGVTYGVTGLTDVRTGGGVTSNSTNIQADTTSSNNDYYLAFVYPLGSIVSQPTGFVSIYEFTGRWQGAYRTNTNGSLIADIWTQTPAAGWGTFLVGFTYTTNPNVTNPGSQTFDVLLADYSIEALPMHRY